MDNTTNIVLKRSTDAGKSWDRHRNVVVGGVNPEAVYDSLTGAVVVAYCGGGSLHAYQDSDASCYHASGSKNRVVVSHDTGLSWRPGASLGPALGAVDGLLPGPGQAIQLRSNATGKQGRLVFAGHKPHHLYSRIGVVWVRDPGGAARWVRTAALPQDSGSQIQAPGPCAELARGPETDYADWGTPVPGCRGPGESTLAELANGTIMLNARNQFCDGGQSGPTGKGWNNSGCFRVKTISTDAGDTWAPLGFDAGLAGDTTQGSLHTYWPTGDLYFSHPWNTLTDSRLNHSLHRSNLTVHRSTDSGGTSRGPSCH
jgi:hypothetical protein